MRKKGFFVVIEGIDGSGKGTQAKLLLKKLRKTKHKTAYFDYPNYETFFGEMVGKYLMGDYGPTDPYLASLLYALNRWEDKEKIAQALAEGRVVVSNRYVSANLIHQVGRIENPQKKRAMVKWLNDLEFNNFKIPQPDLVIFLDVPVAVGQELIDCKEQRAYMKGEKKDEHEKDLAHQKNARTQALKLVKNNVGWMKIGCTKHGKILSREEISDLIWRKLQNTHPIFNK